MTTRSAVRTVYHVTDGPQSMYLVDARSAVSRFPDQWSDTPWRRNGGKTAPIIEIPDGWEDMKPSDRITLAVKLGGKRPGMTAAKADEQISQEVEKRSASEPDAGEEVSVE